MSIGCLERIHFTDGQTYQVVAIQVGHQIHDAEATKNNSIELENRPLVDDGVNLAVSLDSLSRHALSRLRLHDLFGLAVFHGLRHGEYTGPRRSSEEGVVRNTREGILNVQLNVEFRTMCFEQYRGPESLDQRIYLDSRTAVVISRDTRLWVCPKY